ncbi:Inositol oxygenase [Thalictrum thalictroides]|uniref:Inositol oxygenase n=1 Tax=Thalictrum thalictroides TaxID=46969 RepID=A0A7J6W6S8_THATH|nr:Inositol oxygenase [Thalictrum thalictroides]
MREECGKLKRTEISTSESCELLNEFVDESDDPDLDKPQIEHLLQTAEAIRKDHPDEDWLVVPDWPYISMFFFMLALEHFLNGQLWEIHFMLDVLSTNQLFITRLLYCQLHILHSNVVLVLNFMP